jgi:hypothetical protein
MTRDGGGGPDNGFGQGSKRLRIPFSDPALLLEPYTDDPRRSAEWGGIEADPDEVDLGAEPAGGGPRFEPAGGGAAGAPQGRAPEPDRGGTFGTPPENRSATLGTAERRAPEPDRGVTFGTPPGPDPVARPGDPATPDGGDPYAAGSGPDPLGVRPPAPPPGAAAHPPPPQS